MLTRCPSCATHFRVTPEQLKVRGGRVRCGECQNIFNALDSLIEEPVVVTVPVAAAVPPAPTPEEIPGSAAVPVADNAEEADEFPSSQAEEIAVPPAAPFEPAPEASESLAADPGVEAAAPETEIADLDATAEATAEDWIATFPEPPPPPRRWPWVIGSLIALVAIVLQALLAFRVELVVLWPEAKPALVALCEMADCEVGLPAKVGLVGIEASDLHPDSEHKGRLVLAATLKNRAPFAQQFPHLELTLTDTADQAIARKVLAPADYLPSSSLIAGGMKPNADIPVAIGIDSGEIAASGYRLYLFYP